MALDLLTVPQLSAIVPVGVWYALTRFEEEAKRHKPAIVALGTGVNLFPLPVPEMKAIIAPWDRVLYFDGAHQAWLIAGGCYPNPLSEGADLLTGSTGKTFSGPQGGVLYWNGDRFTGPICDETIKEGVPVTRFCWPASSSWLPAPDPSSIKT